MRCRIKDLQINSTDKLVVFSPLEELCVETELVIFDSTELLKSRRKFVEVMIYNPTSSEIRLKKGTVLGQVSDAAAAYTLPVNRMPTASVDQINVDDLNPDFKKVIDEIKLEDLNEEDLRS